MSHSLRPLLAGLPLAAGIGLALPAQAADTVRFGVPSWPGITVKTEIASQLLAPLGYQAQTDEIGLQVIYQGMESGDVDVFLGGWLPAQEPMLTPMEDKGSVKRIANNVDGAQMTLAVPEYVYEQGVTSFEDLDENRDMFKGQIHGFGAGSAASEILNKAIDNDTWGLGDWQLVDTSTVGMLSAARDSISREEPIVWVGWTPHWMNLELPMRYLDDSKNLFGEGNGASQVLTLMSADYAEANPNLTTFFENFTFTAEQQSWMIKAFGLDEKELDTVATTWIEDHPDRVEEMLDGVTTADGDAAWPVVQEALSLED
ncbi:ABC transporter substrate-binding protein [Chromohalobacter canadensis]|uniref:ABC transporter substrate-binding protein n=1 Tax=Chromohalobacter canadensis TaxID=141389 RepID=A0A285VGK8_9GAMM|nr:ABC transporter substrate-binding protein [Chromohalobacter canadensis]MCK0767413.1 ABC transporter substrate-binding protein [Chromohalobacter canadensis]MCT8468491.1 ABC transporter substrate-binding protein [Chromohalobacter canadensis]MCT8471546.1 ABC transporter substrate-binding protein [Chromohalobacter canadensis]MCT8498999.1 ABC transporter substrate-binding protein [Chromohalobacter canadensis]WQH09983.1 ABC transporter substrate-binding protein [Chromohalobacter canadensis]